MAIVKMKKLALIGLLSEREPALDELLRLGCVEISASESTLADPEYAQLLHSDGSELTERTAELSRITAALELLDKHSPKKTGLFTKRQEKTVEQLFSAEGKNRALAAAEEIIRLEAGIDQITAEKSRLRAERAALEPWLSLDIPLEIGGTRETKLIFAQMRANASLEKLIVALEPEEAQLYPINTDRDQHYFTVIHHNETAEAVTEILQKFACTIANFAGLSGTAKANAARLDNEIQALDLAIADNKKAIAAFDADRDDMKLATDMLRAEISKESAKDKLLSTQQVYTLSGWVPVPELKKAQAVFDKYSCAYELSDPTPEDDVPTKLKNNIFTSPFMMVTEMYSLPAYTGIDPNPLIAPFFALFFGIMYGDLGYGLVLVLLGVLALKFMKPRGVMKQMAGLLVICGAATCLCGFLFGSFFGDMIPTLQKMFGLQQTEVWQLINPLQEPMVLLLGSLVLGFIQILFSMAVKAYMLIRDGRWLDAIFDIGSWWVFFAGLALGVLGITWMVLFAGLAMIILTQGRAKPTVIGKLIGGIAGLYDIVNYLSDILSYMRLMALLLASSVVASVVNVLGSLNGSIIVFVIVFLFGHLLNMGINIIGTFVHAARLQFLEFFGRFYEDGGRPFEPMSINTKYVDIIKEEK